MSAARGSELERSAKDLLVTRVFDAPVGLVYEAWTEPRHVVHWWKPQGFAPGTGAWRGTTSATTTRASSSTRHS